HDGKTRCETSVRGQVVKRRNQLAIGQISRGAEDDDRAWVRRGLAVIEICREDFCNFGRTGDHFILPLIGFPADAQVAQLYPQLRGVLIVNRVHAHPPSTLEIQCPVVNKHAFLRSALRHPQGQPVDRRVRLQHAQKTRTEKCHEVSVQAELLDAMQVQLQAFIINRGHQVLPRARQISDDCAGLGMLARLREHKGLERLPRECARLEEYGSLEVFVQRDLASLECGDGQVMSLAELVPVQVKFAGGALPGGTVPSVAQNDSAHIPEQGADLSHGRPRESFPYALPSPVPAAVLVSPEPHSSQKQGPPASPAPSYIRGPADRGGAQEVLTRNPD